MPYCSPVAAPGVRRALRQRALRELGSLTAPSAPHSQRRNDEHSDEDSDGGCYESWLLHSALRSCGQTGGRAVVAQHCWQQGLGWIPFERLLLPPRAPFSLTSKAHFEVSLPLVGLQAA